MAAEDTDRARWEGRVETLLEGIRSEVTHRFSVLEKRDMDQMERLLIVEQQLRVVRTVAVWIGGPATAAAVAGFLRAMGWV